MFPAPLVVNSLSNVHVIPNWLSELAAEAMLGRVVLIANSKQDMKNIRVGAYPRLYNGLNVFAIFFTMTFTPPEVEEKPSALFSYYK
ncbi:hypothetical protein ES707_21490 [subsurface metagenome]